MGLIPSSEECNPSPPHSDRLLDPPGQSYAYTCFFLGGQSGWVVKLITDPCIVLRLSIYGNFTFSFSIKVGDCYATI
jgi:hypothetical protein